MIKTHYLETVFLVKQSAPELWPDAFAVVTACNPLGEIADEKANRSATARLKKTIGRLGLKHRRLAGMSADKKHREASFAIWGCDLRLALDLGKQFSQDAIFWIEDGRLDVVSCSTGERQHAALWPERLSRAGEKPKLCSVYVIKLEDTVRKEKKVREANPDANPKMKCVYVGSTAKTPAERLSIHKVGGQRSSSIVRKYGVRLIPALSRNYPPMTRPQAERKEKQLAKQLRAKGYTVWQN